ncbi:unnamed protein product [Allacma fusca]|uniref:Uncharacterized protein n=1 Tax=Allacma fusca TaxID=39272 RepID=A0A8J2JEJ0_9HEXA|nr:unnamed protein product [Allacma fusca]
MQLSRFLKKLLMIGVVMTACYTCILAVPSRSLVIPETPYDINGTGRANSTNVKQTCFSGRCRYPDRCCPGYRCHVLSFAPFMTGICLRDFGNWNHGNVEAIMNIEEDHD